jgi:hypothetical protein
MWKVLLISSLIALNAHADKRAHSDEISAEQQDEEKYAVAKGNPQEGDPVDGDQCLGDVSVQKYEKASARATDYVLKNMRDGGNNGRSLRVVRESLISANLLTTQPLGANSKDAGPLLQKQGFVNLLQCPEWAARLKDPKKIPLGAVMIYEPLDPKKEFGAIRMKTPQGCFGAAERVSEEELSAGVTRAEHKWVPRGHVRKKANKEAVEKILNDKAADEYAKTGGDCGKNPGYKLIGVYVKNVN